MARRAPAQSKPKGKALAFAGPGFTTKENAEGLLNDFLGFDGDVPDDDETYLVLPVSASNQSKGLLNVFEWVDEMLLEYDVITDGTGRKAKEYVDNAKDVIKSKDIRTDLLEQLQEAAELRGLDPYLIVLWGEDDEEVNRDDVTEMMEFAAKHGIPTLDLTAGLDDIALAPEEDEKAPEPEPEPEPEPVEEEKPKRRGRSRKPMQAEEKPLSDKVPPTPANEETLQESLNRMKREADAEAEKSKGVPGSSEEPEPLVVPLETVLYPVPDCPEKTYAAQRLEEAIYWLTKAYERHREEPTAEGGESSSTSGRGRGRPRKDGTPAQPRSAAAKAFTEYFDEETGEWVRAGRGRIPKDVQTRKVDPKTGEIVED